MNGPGPETLSFEAVHQLWMSEKQRIIELAKAVVRIGCHPTVSKWASWVVIHNLAEDDDI
jgi:hypothetical protein